MTHYFSPKLNNGGIENQIFSYKMTNAVNVIFTSRPRWLNDVLGKSSVIF